jgi:hypothetical protein
MGAVASPHAYRRAWHGASDIDPLQAWSISDALAGD